MSILDAKVSALIASADAGAEPASEAPNPAPPQAAASSGADSASDEPKAAPQLADVIAEKLARAREEREAKQAEKRARLAREEAARVAEEAKAAKAEADAERERLKALKTGTFLDAIKAAGRDPREVFAEMQQEAIEAGTPEAQMRRMQVDFDRRLKEETERVTKAIRDELEAERRTAREQAAAASFDADFARTLATPAYESLRDEYDDDALLGYARALRDNPGHLHAMADAVGVKLEDRERGFNMRDILNVLAAKQAEHESARERRRAARAAAAKPSQAAQAVSTPVVNGTSASRNAGATTIGNDLATERASDGTFAPRGSSASSRIRERVRRLANG